MYRFIIQHEAVVCRSQARSLEPASAYTQEFPDDKTWKNVLVCAPDKLHGPSGHLRTAP